MTDKKDLKRKILKELNLISSDLEFLRSKLPPSEKAEYDWFVLALAKMRGNIIEDMVAEKKNEDRKKRAYVFKLLEDIKAQLNKKGAFGSWMDLEEDQLRHLRLICEMEGIEAEAQHDNLFLEFKYKKKGS